MATDSATVAANAVDPAAVPTIKLASGDQIPVVGMGTFGSDHITPQQVAEAVIQAASIGYRHFDCAAVYSNEAEIGEALASVIASGVPRDSLWVTSKLWNDQHAKPNVIPAFEKSLSNLRLEHLDLYLVHWPFPNFHPPGCDVTSRSADSKPYIHEAFMETWGELEKLVQKGAVRNIGVSNVTAPKLELILRDASVKPAVNEIELHPHFQQPELFELIANNGIVPIGHCPLGSPGRPDRDRAADDTIDLQDPVILAIAQRLGVHPAIVCLKWGIQRGQVVIPFSTNPRNLLSNLRCATTPPLTPEDMQAIAAIDKNCRLIKGQVFLWKDNQSWEDLWDLDGSIPQ